VVTKTISVALLIYPGLGLAMWECNHWRSCCELLRKYYVVATLIYYNYYNTIISTDLWLCLCITNARLLYNRVVLMRHYEGVYAHWGITSPCSDGLPEQVSRFVFDCILWKW